MESIQYIKILDYFDSFLYDTKFSNTNLRYNGIILDQYFDDSILSVDYLNINDYFQSNGGFNFDDTNLFSEQYNNLKNEYQLRLIENVMNILKCTTLDKEMVEKKISKLIAFLKRQKIIIEEVSKEQFKLLTDKIVNSGSYCNIVLVDKGILRKELRQEYKYDPKYQKRMKYEFNNMTKLADCPQVLNVFDYNDNAYSYMMEEAEMNLYEYLNTEIDITFEKKMKIIYDILYGMDEAHKKSIIHRDLHLGNILKISNNFVISDFGLSKDESVARSLKSSATEKNSHIFVDPVAYGDFTKLDKKSDIYAIGKLIDYILSDGENSLEHLFSYIVEKCTNRLKEKRYDNISSIIEDINFAIKEQSRVIDKKVILEKILNNIFNIQVSEYIMELIKEDKLCDYIVTNKLYNFGRIIIQFEVLDQMTVLNNIDLSYAESTGYNGWNNYDIFADIVYYVCRNTKDLKIFQVAKEILEGCANVRYGAADYLKQLEITKL